MKAFFEEYTIETRHNPCGELDGADSRFDGPALYDLSFSVVCDWEAAERFVAFMRQAFGVDVPGPTKQEAPMFGSRTRGLKP